MKSTRKLGERVAGLGLFIGCVFSGLAQTNFILVTNLSGNFGQLAGTDHYLFSAGSTTLPTPALHIYDISNPVVPVDLGYEDGGGGLSGILLSPPRAYEGVAGGFNMGVNLLDITNPTNPIFIGNIPGVPNDAMAVSGNKLYLLDAYDGNVAIYDVSNPSSPANVGAINGLQVGMKYLFAKEKYLFAVGGYGLYVYDVSNPAASTLVGSVPPAGSTGLWGAVMSGDYVFVTSSTNGLWIANVSSPTNPVVVFHQISFPLNLTGIAISGNYAYVGFGALFGGEQSGVRAYDVSNPTNAFVVAQTASYGVAGGYTVAVSRSHLYSESSTIMSIYSLGFPSAPPLSLATTSTNTLLLSWPTPTLAFAVQENPNLNPTNWLTLPNTPVVVGSNNQVTIPNPAGTMFYRLVSQ